LGVDIGGLNQSFTKRCGGLESWTVDYVLSDRIKRRVWDFAAFTDWKLDGEFRRWGLVFNLIFQFLVRECKGIVYLGASYALNES
jgi:hypothetical protein